MDKVYNIFYAYERTQVNIENYRVILREEEA